MPVKVIVIGALGRMGREIGKILLGDRSVSLEGCLEIKSHPMLGIDYGTALGKESSGIPVVADLSDVPVEDSVIINFSLRDALDDFLLQMGDKKTRLVIGTTGLGDDTITTIKKKAENIPVVCSPNMSLGVNLLFHLTELLSSRLKDEFDIEIVEAHHRLKKDSPSGTAKRLGEIAASALGLSYGEAIRHGRAGLVGERTDKEIGMHAVRGGDIVGDHTVLFAGPNERIELRHMAHSRAVFAQGAVFAAKWLAKQGPGLYSMHDVLGL